MAAVGSVSLVGTDSKEDTQKDGEAAAHGVVAEEWLSGRGDASVGADTGRDDLAYIRTLVNESVRQRETKCPSCGLPKSHKRTRLNYSRFACPCDVDVAVRGEEARHDYNRYGVDSTLKPGGDAACRGDCDQSMLVTDPSPIISLLQAGPPEDTPASCQNEVGNGVLEDDAFAAEAVGGASSFDTNNSAIGPDKKRFDHSLNDQQVLSSAADHGSVRIRRTQFPAYHRDTRRAQSTVPLLSRSAHIGSVDDKLCEIFYNPPKSQKTKSHFSLATNQNNCYLDYSKQGLECVCVSRHSSTGFRLDSAKVRTVAPIPKKSYLCRPALGVHTIEICFPEAENTSRVSGAAEEDTEIVESSVAHTLNNNFQTVQRAPVSSKTGNSRLVPHQRNKTFVSPCQRDDYIVDESVEIFGNLKKYNNARGEGRGLRERKVRQAASADNNIKLVNGALKQTHSANIQVQHPYFSLAPPSVIATRRRLGHESQQMRMEPYTELTPNGLTFSESENHVFKKFLAQLPYSSPNELYGLGDSFSSERNNSNGATSQRESSFVGQQWVGRVVRVEGDGRCLFRSLVTASCPKLQTSRRDEFGRPERPSDAEEETIKADELRALVVRLMKDNLHFYSQLERGVINADQPATGNYQKFNDRLEAMSNNHTMPGELELNAAAMVLERMILVLNIDFVLITTYGQDRYPQSKPLAVRFTRLGPDVGHYDAVILADDEPAQGGFASSMGSSLKNNLLSACDLLSKLTLQDGKNTNKDGLVASDKLHKQISTAPSRRRSSTQNEAIDSPCLRSSACHMKGSKAHDSPLSSCHKQGSKAHDSPLSSCHKQGSKAHDSPLSSCHKQGSKAHDSPLSSCHEVTSDSPEERYSPLRNEATDSPGVRSSACQKQAIYAHDSRSSSCNKVTSDASEIRYSPMQNKARDSPGVCFSACHKHKGNDSDKLVSPFRRDSISSPQTRPSRSHKVYCDAPDPRPSSCPQQRRDTPEMRKSQADGVGTKLTSRPDKRDHLVMNHARDPSPQSLRSVKLSCRKNNNKRSPSRRRRRRPRATCVGTQRVAQKRRKSYARRSSRVHSSSQPIQYTYTLVPQFMWAVKLGEKDKNYNSRSGVRKRRDRSKSDSDSSPERKKKYRKFSPSPSAKKKTPGRRRRDSSTESRYFRTDSTPGTSRGQAQPSPLKRKLAKRSKSARSSNSSDTNVNPDVEVQPPLPPRLPEAFAVGQCQCLLCGKRVVMSRENASWLKCYLCGRVAHRECVVKHSPAWGRGKDDDIYFLCNYCVPE